MTAPPREPTVVMTNEGVNVMRVTGGNIYDDVRAMWRAMYDAAPAPRVAEPRSADCVRVCPVKDIVCSTPDECDQRETGCKMLINVPDAVAQPAEPPATDDLVRELRNPPGGYISDLLKRAADLIERQAREIARVKVQLTSEITAALAERDALRLANIDAANLLAECSDMSVDIEKYRNEIAELKSERDAAQRAGVTTANYWMKRAELAEDQCERTRDVWATRAERAEAERDALREVVKAADAYCAELDKADLSHVNTAGMLASECPICNARYALDAARAKVKP